jgi:hypothetical protein
MIETGQSSKDAFAKRHCIVPGVNTGKLIWQGEKLGLTWNNVFVDYGRLSIIHSLGFYGRPEAPEPWRRAGSAQLGSNERRQNEKLGKKSKQLSVRITAITNRT